MVPTISEVDEAVSVLEFVGISRSLDAECVSMLLDAVGVGALGSDTESQRI